MEVKKGDKVIGVPAWVAAVGLVTIGKIVTEICNAIRTKRD